MFASMHHVKSTFRCCANLVSLVLECDGDKYFTPHNILRQMSITHSR